MTVATTPDVPAPNRPEIDLSSSLPPAEIDRLTDDIIAALKSVYDPEIPADISRQVRRNGRLRRVGPRGRDEAVRVEAVLILQLRHDDVLILRVEGTHDLSQQRREAPIPLDGAALVHFGRHAAEDETRRRQSRCGRDDGQPPPLGHAVDHERRCRRQQHGAAEGEVNGADPADQNKGEQDAAEEAA